MDKMEKTYDPSFEKRIYDFWLKGKYFEAHPNDDKEPFTVMMPPPNITGQLHMGHALNQTIQDIIIRFKRMSGYEALWLPGTDHASIATEVKIVEQMKKEEGLTKADVGREGFLERAWAWKDKYGGRIVEQLKRLGTSCDWSKEAFTMDKNLSAAVVDAFVRYYKKGLIYRGDRIINWCPHCKTALSDAEVEYREQQSNLWYYRYPFADGDGSLTIATTRPETMLGDTAVAVNPKDERMAGYVGRMLRLPLTDRVIPVVADDYVEIGFGTGAVKITPAHDPNDFELGLRHDLPVIRVIDDEGRMNENAGKYCGMDRLECRAAVVKDLEEQGYMEKIEPYAHNVGECYRCGETVEAIVSKQWFVKMKPLAEPAIKAVKSKKVEFIPKRFEKTYYNWMENIKDWCMVLRRLRRDRGGEDRARVLPQVRRTYASGRGRAGHVVQLGALAFQHAGVSEEEQKPVLFLSHQRSRHGVRYHILLGGEDDLQRHRDDARAALLRSAHPRAGARRQRQEDVQERGQRR